MPVDPLRLAGLHDAPIPLSEVMARRFVAGSGQPPAALRVLAGRQDILIENPRAGESSLELTAVPESGGRLWQATVVGEGQRLAVRPGLSAERRAPVAFLGEVDASLPTSGYHPDAADLTFAPRPRRRGRAPPWDGCTGVRSNHKEYRKLGRLVLAGECGDWLPQPR